MIGIMPEKMWLHRDSDEDENEIFVADSDPFSDDDHLYILATVVNAKLQKAAAEIALLKSQMPERVTVDDLTKVIHSIPEDVSWREVVQQLSRFYPKGVIIEGGG